jgi:hypothetical protein
VTDHTAVGVRVALNAGFHAARARLRILVNGGTLPRVCEVAYAEGIAGLAELAGPAAGLTRLAGVCLEDLTETDDCAHIALHWEAIAADGKLFTALLADLMLIPAGNQVTAVSVTGTYWPPPGRAGTGLGQAIAPLRHGRTRQLPGLGGLRARPSCGHGRAVSWPGRLPEGAAMTAEDVCHAWTVWNIGQRTDGTNGPGRACPLPPITPEVRRR